MNNDQYKLVSLKRPLEDAEFGVEMAKHHLSQCAWRYMVDLTQLTFPGAKSVRFIFDGLKWESAEVLTDDDYLAELNPRLADDASYTYLDDYSQAMTDAFYLWSDRPTTTDSYLLKVRDEGGRKL